MARSDLEARLTKLEAEVHYLKTAVDRESTPVKDWRAIVGTFADDPMFEEAIQLGREYRESLRPKSSSRRKAPR
ncbi:hypothetical protein [Tautonia plasticadhaerens]|uniref:Uncharacterized protein n=1 Tax=Tautonia plasticadhaerens TaxID=2527974 RepID=A0A518H2K5_9BACT|nr:hypothetical protein [Tautonia plasticadhaerens]QDV35089.1 hypothetical protein ElP_29910 [Tautonia plasticadhaerens]